MRPQPVLMEAETATGLVMIGEKGVDRRPSEAAAPGLQSSG